VARHLGITCLDDLPEAEPLALPPQPSGPAPPVSVIVAAAARVADVEPSSVRAGSRGRSSRARRLASVVALRDHGYSRRAVADAAGCTPMAVTRGLAAGLGDEDGLREVRQALERLRPSVQSS
jgi:hypothetical protein